MGGRDNLIFDDITRPTKVEEIIPFVLEELKMAGVPDKAVRFMAALGAHGAMNLIEFRKKPGERVLDRFPVYNHNCYEYCTKIGETSHGTPVIINQEVMLCDLKIAIGCIVPHPGSGFGGGGKIVLPGVASIDSIEANHKLAGKGKPERGHLLGKPHPTVGRGKYEGSIIIKDIFEATQMVKLDVKIDAVVNRKRETVGLFVGDPAMEHEKGVELAKKIYRTEKKQDANIIVANAYSKENESIIAIDLALEALSDKGGYIVVVVCAPAGQVTHYTRRSSGKKIGGRVLGPQTSP